MDALVRELDSVTAKIKLGTLTHLEDISAKHELLIWFLIIQKVVETRLARGIWAETSFFLEIELIGS